MPSSKTDLDKMGTALAKMIDRGPVAHSGRRSDAGRDDRRRPGRVARADRRRAHGAQVRRQRRRRPAARALPRDDPAPAQRVEYRHKKQTGGAGQFGDVVIDLEPLPDQDFEFAEKIVGGSVPRQYIPGVEKGVREAIHEGPLAGYPVVRTSR